MADFRIPVELGTLVYDYIESELDWDRNTKQWTLSEREKGLGRRWTEGIIPSSRYLNILISFFRLPNGLENTPELFQLSPGELSLIHRDNTSEISIFATLCFRCLKHWIVFKKINESNGWRAFGRSCDFDWRIEAPLSEAEGRLLGQLLQEKSSDQ